MMSSKAALPNAEQVELLFVEALQLLQRLIAAPSFSREEAGTAAILEQFFQQKNILMHCGIIHHLQCKLFLYI